MRASEFQSLLRRLTRPIRYAIQNYYAWVVGMSIYTFVSFVFVGCLWDDATTGAAWLPGTLLISCFPIILLTLNAPILMIRNRKSRAEFRKVERLRHIQKLEAAYDRDYA